MFHMCHESHAIYRESPKASHGQSTKEDLDSIRPVALHNTIPESRIQLPVRVGLDPTLHDIKGEDQGPTHDPRNPTVNKTLQC